MIVLVPVLVLASVLLNGPAFLYSCKKGRESWWLLFCVVPGIAVWGALTAAGIGAQSLSNLAELLWLAAAAVLLSYGKVFLLDPWVASATRSTYVLMALLAAAAVGLRLLTPVFPE